MKAADKRRSTIKRRDVNSSFGESEDEGLSSFTNCPHDYFDATKSESPRHRWQKMSLRAGVTSVAIMHDGREYDMERCPQCGFVRLVK